MRLAKVSDGARSAPAIIQGDQARLIGPWTQGDPIAAPFEVAGLGLAELEALSRSSAETVALSAVRLEPPVGFLSKIICLGLNYKNHVEETHSDAAENPSLFTKLPDALVGADAPIVRPKVSEHFDYEGEIVVVIGKPGRHISKADAMSHVFGYTVMMDGSVRDYQKHSASAGKCFWRSGSLGPWIVTADEIPDPTRLSLETRLSGQTVQSTTADLMIFDIPTAISYISGWTPLAAGDVIATGTPGGVGARRTPPLWMKPGDVIEVEVSGVGVLANPVIDEA